MYAHSYQILSLSPLNQTGRYSLALWGIIVSICGLNGRTIHMYMYKILCLWVNGGIQNLSVKSLLSITDPYT